MSVEMRVHLSRYIVDSQRERKGVGNPGEPAAKKEGGLDDALLFDILFANNVAANKSPVETTKEPIQTEKSPQVKAKKASTKT